MLKVGNKTLDVSVEDVITTLRDYLAARGIQRFRELKIVNDDIHTNCPIHKDGNERRPSCGILLKDKNGKSAGTVHCFTCGYTATIDEMISNILGYDDKGEMGRSWLMEQFVEVQSINRQIEGLTLTRQKTQTDTSSYITEQELDSYRFYHPYMYKRKLTDEIIEKFDIGFDKSCGCITFPIKDIKGNCVFVARRSVRGKFFNYPTGVNKPVYMLDYAIAHNEKELYVCESFINALTLRTWGYPAIALIGTGSAQQYNILNSLNIRCYKMCFDGDEAGHKGAKNFCNKIKGALIYYINIPEGKDVNDLTKEEFDALDIWLEK